MKKIRKRNKKVRIPAAVDGLEAPKTNYAADHNKVELGAPALIGPNGLPVSTTSTDLSKLGGNINKLKQPLANKNGNGGGGMANLDVGTLASATSGGIATIMGVGAESLATTGKEAVQQSLSDISSGISSGAQMGSAFGPLGSLIGGGVGAIIGGIGRKGREAEMTSFTDYNEGNLSTGLMALGNGKLREERRRIRINAQNNRSAVTGTNNLQVDWNNKYGGISTNTFAEGGMMPGTLAYVDDGELIQTPDGSVTKVPEQGKPTDSNLVSLPAGSRVLSDKLKVPGTKKTFAQMGEEMMIKKKSKYSDRFAENSNKLNEMNNNLIHDKLFAMQEEVKNKKGIKPKTKELTLKNGGLIPAYSSGYDPEEEFAAAEEAASWYNFGKLVVSDSNKELAESKRVRKWLNLTRSYEEPFKDLTEPSKKNERTFNWGSALTDLASLTPIMSNLFTSKAENVNANYNPYARAIANTMGRRRFNIDSATQDILRNRANANYNASALNTNTGANLAYSLQSAINTDRAISALRSQQQNANNSYTADYANVMNNLGQQWVAETNRVQEANAANRAAARNIRRTGFSQLSNWAQNKELMRNIKERDLQMWPLYERFLQAGFTDTDLSAYINWKRNNS